MSGRRKHTYLLKFDSGPPETHKAHTPSEAVAMRGNTLLPSTITDLTTMNDWAHHRALGAESKTPLYDLRWGKLTPEPVERVPIRGARIIR